MATDPADTADTADTATRAATVVAELRVIGEAVNTQADRVAGFAASFLGSGHDDVVTMIHEAERQLQIAARAITRAITIVER